MTDSEKLERLKTIVKEMKQWVDPETKVVMSYPDYDQYLYRLDDGGYIDWLVEQAEKAAGIKTITQLCTEAYQTAKSKGWHDEPIEMGTRLALVHSEVSEALEADRKGDRENFAEELADTCIRIFDLCGEKGIDLEKAIIKKMEYNKGRSYKHGGKRY